MDRAVQFFSSHSVSDFVVDLVIKLFFIVVFYFIKCKYSYHFVTDR